MIALLRCEWVYGCVRTGGDARVRHLMDRPAERVTTRPKIAMIGARDKAGRASTRG